MSLVTRCPRCQTLFRVVPAQLQARAGQVRCGRCMHTFDGFQALAVEQANAVSEPVRFEPEAAETPAGAPPASAPAPSKRAPAAAAAVESPRAPPAPPVEESTPDATQTRLVTPLRHRVMRKPTPEGKRVALCVFLGVVLALQLAMTFRSQLAGRYPMLRSALGAMCGVAGCTVTLPQRPDLVKIEASDVHMIDANRPALIQLTATLRSYANYDLAYPALDLVLTNANEHALARRIFMPQEYLDRTRDPDAGIAPRAEITVALDLDTGDLNAAGFRLDLIAAPAP